MTPAIRVESERICKEQLTHGWWKITFKRGDEVVGEIKTKTPDWWVEELEESD